METPTLKMGLCPSIHFRLGRAVSVEIWEYACGGWSAVTQSWKLPSWILPIWSIGIHCVCVCCVCCVRVCWSKRTTQTDNSIHPTFTQTNNGKQQQTTNDNTVSISHGAAEEGGFLYERFPRSRLLAGDLVEGEQKMVPLRYLRRQLYLDFLIELRLPVRVSVFVCALMCVCFVCLCISVCLFLCLFCLFVY